MQGRFLSPGTTWRDDRETSSPSDTLPPLYSVFHSPEEETIFESSPIIPPERPSIPGGATATHLLGTVCCWYPAGHAIATGLASWFSQQFIQIRAQLSASYLSHDVCKFILGIIIQLALIIRQST